MGNCVAYIANAADMREIKDDSVQLIITSPFPLNYGCPETDSSYSMLTKMMGASYHPYDAVIKECFRVLKSDGVFIWASGVPGEKFDTPENLTPINFLVPFITAVRILMMAPFKLQFQFMLHRQVACNALQYLDNKIVQNFEYLFVFSKNNRWFFNWNLDRYLQTVILVREQPSRTVEQPTSFNEGVIETLMKLFSREGDLVLDPMAGTGTVGKVATALNRNSVLYEVNPKMRQVILEKVEDAKLIDCNR